jgi:hypothetical protein
VKTSQKTIFFDPSSYPSMERLIINDSMVMQLWNPITLRNPEDGSDMLPETLVKG